MLYFISYVTSLCTLPLLDKLEHDTKGEVHEVKMNILLRSGNYRKLQLGRKQYAKIKNGPDAAASPTALVHASTDWSLRRCLWNAIVYFYFWWSKYKLLNFIHLYKICFSFTHTNMMMLMIAVHLLYGHHHWKWVEENGKKISKSSVLRQLHCFKLQYRDGYWIVDVWIEIPNLGLQRVARCPRSSYPRSPSLVCHLNSLDDHLRAQCPENRVCTIWISLW